MKDINEMKKRIPSFYSIELINLIFEMISKNSKNRPNATKIKLFSNVSILYLLFSFFINFICIYFRILYNLLEN